MSLTSRLPYLVVAAAVLFYWLTFGAPTGELTTFEKQVVLDFKVIGLLIAEMEDSDGKFPGSDDTLRTLDSVVELHAPPYSGRWQSKDPWGNKLLYVSMSGGVAVFSPGFDGRLDTDYLAIRGSEWERVPGDDIVMFDGELVKWPLSLRDRQIGTMADLRSIATAIEEYSIDNNVYPNILTEVDFAAAIAEHIEPLYVRTMPRVDGWGRQFLGVSRPDGYQILSAGADGVQDWEVDLLQCHDRRGGTDDPARDIVFCNGQFVQWPSGYSQ